MDNLELGVSIETEDQTGEILSVYFHVRKGWAKTTKEYVEGIVFADYDKEGKLLGIEMLAPCEITVLDQIARSQRVKKFVHRSIPRGMLVPA